MMIQPVPAAYDRGAPSPFSGRPVSRAVLREAALSGTLTPDAWEEASRFLGFRPDARAWGEFWKRVFTLYGTLFLVSGIIFFIAWNWADMHRFVKLGLMQVLVAAALAGAVFKGVDSRPGRLCLLAGGILIGPLLAVHGQLYQTGAELWELFRLWAALLLVPAVVGRRPSLWFVCWLIAYTGGALYFAGMADDAWDAVEAVPYPMFLFGQAVVWSAWESAALVWGAKHPWLKERWFPRTMGLVCLIGCTVYTIAFILTDWWPTAEYGRPALPPGVVLYLVLLPAVLVFFRKKTPDLFLLSCAVFSLCGSLLALLLNAELFFSAGIELGTLLWSGLVIGLSTAAGKLLLAWQRRMEQERGPAESVPARAGASGGPPRSPEALQRHLHSLGLWTEGAPPLAFRPAGTPWFILLFQGFAGWVASLLLFCCIVFVLILLDIVPEEGESFILGSVPALAGAAFFSRLPHQAAKQFCLAAGLAGSGAAAVGAGMLAWPNPVWPLAASAALWLGFLLVRSFPFRFLAAAGGVALLLACQWAIRAGIGSMSLLWLFCCVSLAAGYLREKHWVGHRLAAALVPPLLYGFFAAAAVFLYLCVIPAAVDPAIYGQYMHMALSAQVLGAAAGVALIPVSVLVSKRSAAPPAIRILFLGAAVCTALLGWHLPGAALGFLGLTLATLSGDRVLAGCCGLFIACYVFQYYYTLHLSLLYKSLTLIAVGAVLLALGLGLERLIGPAGTTAGNETEAGHA